MCDILKREFQLKKFWFDHHKPDSFYTAQWRWHPAIYIIYRVIVACYSVACLLAIEIQSNSSNTLAYLTIWTYLILCLYQLTALFTSIFCIISCRGNSVSCTENTTLVKPKMANENDAAVAVENLGYIEDANISNLKVPSASNGTFEIHPAEPKNYSVEQVSMSNTEEFKTHRISWYMKLTWLLGSILYIFGIIVTVIYFSALFPYIGVTDGFIHDLNMHAFNSLQILIDIAIIARPIRMLHIIYPLLYGLCYVIFSIIYWLQDKKNNVLYPNVLDWNKPGTTIMVMVLLAFVGAPVLQLLLFGVYRLRLHIYKKLYQAAYLD